MSEQDLVRRIIATVNASGLAEVWRCHSGMVKVRRAFMHLAPVGTPDIIGFLRDGRFLGLECKLPKEQPTAEQKATLARIVAAGGVADVVRSVDEAVALIQHALDAEAA
jgi:hypothetical protein